MPTLFGVKRGVLVTVAGIALFAVLVVAVTPLREGAEAVLRGDTSELRRNLRDLGFAGVLVLFALIVSHAVLFYPSEIVNAAAGYVYGFGPALALVMVGWTVSGLVAYAIGHHVGRPALRRLAGQRRLERAERAVDRGGTVGLLAARLIPVVPYSAWAMSPAPPAFRCGASPGRPSSARCRSARRSSTSAGAWRPSP